MGKSSNAKKARKGDDSPPSPCSLLRGLIALTDQEDKKGGWRVTLDYDNYQDGARVLNGDGKVIGECYAHNEKIECPELQVEWQFVEAIRKAVAANMRCDTCRGDGVVSKTDDDGIEHAISCQTCGGSGNANAKVADPKDSAR